MYESLPNSAAVPATESVGFFGVTGTEFADWLISGLCEEGTRWGRRELIERERNGLLSLLSPPAQIGVTRYIVLSSSGWAAVLNNAKHGTDLGMLPSLATRQLNCRAMRAMAIEESGTRFGATALEVFEPDAELPLRCRRTISAANDGGTWSFDQYGEPFSFEDGAAYRLRRIRDRFTPALLFRYLTHMGVPEFRTKSLGEYSPILIERLGD